MSYNPSNYTRCEKCKHIDRENEKCKITNDNWLVSDKAGTCRQFEGVESMEKETIKIENKKGFKVDDWVKITDKEVATYYYTTTNQEFRVLEIDTSRVRLYANNTKGYVWINNEYVKKVKNKNEKLEENPHEKLDNDISRIDLVLKTDDYLEYDYKQDVIEFRCPSEFGLKEYRNEQCNSIDDTCCSRCWNELATKEEVERLLNAHKQMEKLEENPHEKLVKEFTFKINTDKEDPIKPSHYQAGEFDVIAFCFKYNLDFASGNVVKYIVRTGKKDKNKELEDLLKAKEYLERKIEWVKANA